MGGSARAAALEALERSRRDGAWSAMALDAAITGCGLDRRDAALASRLYLGVLQNDLYLDHYIDLYLTGKADRLQPKLRDILRIGAYQILLLDKIPVRAAVSESVALCRSQGLERAAGLVNAVLRRLAENRKTLPPLPGEGSTEYLSLRYSHPLWLARRLTEEQGYDTAERFFRANNDTAPLTIQLNTLSVDAESYRRALQRAGLSFTQWPDEPDCFSLPGGNVTELPGYEEGLFYVQDRAAHLAVTAAEPQEGMQVLDACAAPGGKSFACAIAMSGKGRLLSCDIHEKKLRLIRSGAERLGIRCIETVQKDARSYDPALDGRFDLVLADVPCSGLGVIRKRPEIRRKSEAELAGLPQIQEAILDNVSRYVKPGGLLLYSTCTVLRAENAERIEAFLRTHPAFRLEAMRLGGRVIEEGSYQFWPQTDETDGFYAAKLRRDG